MNLLEEIREAIASKVGQDLKMDGDIGPGENVIGEITDEEKAIWVIADQAEKDNLKGKEVILRDLFWYLIRARINEAASSDAIGIRKGCQIVSLPPKKERASIISIGLIQIPMD